MPAAKHTSSRASRVEARIPARRSCWRISIYKLLYVMAIILFVVTFCGNLEFFNLQSLKWPRRVCVRRRKKFKSFFTATCAWGKIPLRLQVWNFCARRKNYARGRLQAFWQKIPQEFSPEFFTRRPCLFRRAEPVSGPRWPPPAWSRRARRW